MHTVFKGSVSQNNFTTEAQRKEGKMSQLEQQDPLTFKIIGAAIEVHRILGPGLLEGVYEDALCIELEERKIVFERQKPIEIKYKGRNIGNLVTDLIVENRVIVELKSVETLLPVHETQLLTYLKLTSLNVGHLINFNVPVLRDGVKRRVL